MNTYDTPDLTRHRHAPPDPRDSPVRSAQAPRDSPGRPAQDHAGRLAAIVAEQQQEIKALRATVGDLQAANVALAQKNARLSVDLETERAFLDLHLGGGAPAASPTTPGRT